MLNAYKKRPGDFKMRILRYVSGNLKDLQYEEQRWLDMIDDKELSISKSVMEGCNRYYNMKKNAVGGNGHANKGNSNIGAWNRGLTKDDPRVKKNGEAVSKAKKGVKFTKEHRINMSLSRGGDGILKDKKLPVYPKKSTSNRYIWTVKDNNGNLYITKNLDKFSKDQVVEGR